MNSPERRCWLALLACITMPGWAQWGYDGRLSTYEDQAVVNPWEHGEAHLLNANRFTFARVRYTRQHRGYGWFTDYPDSDINFSMRLEELTTIEVNRDAGGRIVHAVVDLMDDHLYQFPFIYMVEVGNLDLSMPEAERLRDYLLRGGFLLIDDFWEEDEWAVWEEQYYKIFPDRDAYPLVEIPTSHEIFHTVFDLEEVPQVPSINSWLRFGMSTDRVGAVASCNGVFDQNGRLMMVVLHNTDLGDGWEREGTDYEYFQKFSVARAYPFGINIVVYAMTH